MNESLAQNSTFCYDLPISIGNKTFCGLTEKWKSRFNHKTLLAMTITPVLIYWIILLAMVKTLYEKSTWRWKTAKRQPLFIAWMKKEAKREDEVQYQYLDGVKELFKGDVCPDFR